MTSETVYADLAAAGVPEHLHDGIVNYLVHRIPPGHFLGAVVSNDLVEAIGRADENSLRGLRAIVAFFYNDAPSTSWGSPVKVSAWLRGPR